MSQLARIFTSCRKIIAGVLQIDNVHRLQIVNRAPRNIGVIEWYRGHARNFAEPGGIAQGIAFKEKNVDKPRLANARRVFGYRIKHRLDVARRSRDHAQDFVNRPLLIQGFALLVEQPRVLDGDDGLGGEVFSSSICLSVKGRTS